MTIQRPTAFLIVAATLLASAPRFIAAQAPVPSQSPIPHPGYKSQGTAFMWSLVGTAVAVGLSFAMASDYGDNAGPGLLSPARGEALVLSCASSLQPAPSG